MAKNLMTVYKIIAGKSIDELSNRVTDLVSKGFVPVGSLVIQYGQGMKVDGFLQPLIYYPK